jgi:hypothetical protein
VALLRKRSIANRSELTPFPVELKDRLIILPTHPAIETFWESCLCLSLGRFTREDSWKWPQKQKIKCDISHTRSAIFLLAVDASGKKRTAWVSSSFCLGNVVLTQLFTQHSQQLARDEGKCISHDFCTGTEGAVPGAKDRLWCLCYTTAIAQGAC